MQVEIGGSSINWNSDFLRVINNPSQNTWKKKREDYYSVQVINNISVFVKRTEVGFKSFNLLKSLTKVNLKNVPKIYAAHEVIENNRNVQYLFTEYLKGETLDVVLNRGRSFPLPAFVGSLSLAIESLSRIGFWHADFNADNVFITNNGNAYLIDIDSSVPNNIIPHFDPIREGGLTSLSNQLGRYAYKFYSKYLNEHESYKKLNGSNLNYFQLIFLVQKIKYFKEFKNSNPTSSWRKNTFKNVEFESLLYDLDPKTLHYFRFALDAVLPVAIVEKICSSVIYTRVRSKKKDIPPVIISNEKLLIDFRLSKKKIKKGDTVTLNWKVENYSSFEIEGTNINSENDRNIGSLKLTPKMKSDYTLKVVDLNGKKEIRKVKLDMEVNVEEAINPIIWVITVAIIIISIFILMNTDGI